MNEIEKQNDSSGWNTPWTPSRLGYIRNSFLEASLRLECVIRQKNLNSLIILPCGTKQRNPASMLRAYMLGKELRRNHGWSVTIIPPRFDLEQRRRIIASWKPSLILMQMERHPLNKPRLYNNVPVIFDIDDADFLWPHAKDIVKEACIYSKGVVAGSRYVASWCKQYNSNVEVIWTGGPIQLRCPFKNQPIRKNIVAWGHSRPHDYPKEMEFIEKVLGIVAKKETIEFWIFGVSEVKKVQALISRMNSIGVRIKCYPPMPYQKYTEKLLEVAVGLQVLSDENEFSKGKSFGKILNYLASGTVVVASKAADHPLFFVSGLNGILANTVEEWAEAIISLLNNPEQRLKIARQGFLDYKKRLSIAAFTARYDNFLRSFV